MAMDYTELQGVIGGVQYPTSKTELVQYARERGADDSVLQTIQGLDRDYFESPVDVSTAMSQE